MPPSSRNKLYSPKASSTSMVQSRHSLNAILIAAVVACALVPVSDAQATSGPPFDIGAARLYAHASEDFMTIWMNALEEDGTGPYYITGAPLVPSAAGASPALDPVVDEEFEVRIPLSTELLQDLVLDGDIVVQAYIGGGTYTRGEATISTALAVDGIVVAESEAKTHTMAGSAAGEPYSPIDWTLAVGELVVPKGASMEWVIFGHIEYANNMYLATHAARGMSYIELPVVALALPGAEPEPEPTPTTTAPPSNSTTTGPASNSTTTGSDSNSTTTTPLSADANTTSSSSTSDKKTPGVATAVLTGALATLVVLRRRRIGQA